ncbi:hypothetical protein PROFUN_06311 [Planoprotostelium fungivorum]|uniref:Uncharacterized protein n=1 Tax=Planoprotostelium fungivorum TaxID=1890364 RepID=A0A2P6NP22_9EUKA|nr:hypothetical protein PROFUN_06311 [Planoprotostelium fungivorum]
MITSRKAPPHGVFTPITLGLTYNTGLRSRRAEEEAMEIEEEDYTSSDEEPVFFDGVKMPSFFRKGNMENYWKEKEEDWIRKTNEPIEICRKTGKIVEKN